VVVRGGRIFAGCNVENASYGATLCAERSAVAAMVAAGRRDPILCVVVAPGERSAAPATPCGICRQVLTEFGVDFPVVLVTEDESGAIVKTTVTRLSLLLPHAFRLERQR
jgi:cytidine deaminase